METSIIVSARTSFNNVEQIPIRLQGINYPIELALPHKYDDWQKTWQKSDKLFDALRKIKIETGINIATVHATQAKLNDTAFLEWGQQTILVAENVGAKAITVHPNRVGENKANSQLFARSQLKQLQHHTSVLISLETFAGHNRIFTPDEIIKNKFPMTLDTSHIHDNNKIMNIINDYWQHIPVVHLSARNSESQHLPIDTFCIEVVRKLVKLKWHGTITLEYLRDYHDRFESDIEIVKKALDGHIIIPPPCDTHEEILEELYKGVLLEHDKIQKQLRSTFPGFDSLTDREQDKRYAAFIIGKTSNELAYFLFKAKAGCLTMGRLRTKFKSAKEMMKFMKDNYF